MTRALWFVLTVLCSLGFASLAARAQDRSLESELKAAFLYRFGSYVEWPSSAFAGPRSPVQLCIVGEDPFGATLDRLVQGQTLNDRPITVRRLPTVTPGSGCHIAYLGGSIDQTRTAAARALAGAPVLTVAEAMQAADGAAIQFVVRANRVRFRIDQRAAAASGLVVSSKLLNLAVDVVR